MYTQQLQRSITCVQLSKSGSEHQNEWDAKMQYSDEMLTMWRAGEIEELAVYCNDAKECEGTFFKWVDAGVGYDYPQFFCGNENVFNEHQRRLIEIAQARA